MASRKRLRSVVQCLAHHATSTLCYLHPALGDVLRARGERAAIFDVLATSRPHPLAPSGSPLDRAIEALRQRFQDILASEGMTLADVAEITLCFRFNAEVEPSSMIADVRLVTREGELFRCAVDALGRVRETEER